jgi:acetoin utilization deacetylase AcuC-like enzyme/GNAT superfamily N-acetyltransferase
MFRIRRIYDDILQIDKQEIAQVQAILRHQFALVPQQDIDQLPDMLRNPLKYQFRSILFVADDVHATVKGFALLLHAPNLHFCYLDFISAARHIMGRGIGGALYERVREEALSFKSIGIFFECLPDDPHLCRVPEIIRGNAARLRFYERYGARPIVNTAYETPLKIEDRCPPHLVYDDLGQSRPLRRDEAREIVRAILSRKYAKSAPPEYIDKVVESFQDDPVKLREPRYIKPEQFVEVRPSLHPDQQIRLVVNSHHQIHHVRERGYVESPVRINTILKEIEPTGLFNRVPAEHFPEYHILRVHDPGFVHYFQKVCQEVEPGESVYPYVFPLRNAARPPQDLAVRAGYYCIDTFTPLNQNAYPAARGAVDCALTAAQGLVEGGRLAYALVRPPGHHAERRAFGGFCYLNSTSIAAHYLSAWGNGAILDIDYHHGNGSQQIFYARNDVLVISIHGHPHFAYPYFSGFEDEKGEGSGEGFNINHPLPEDLDGPTYRLTLAKAIKSVADFRPAFLVVSLGLDTAKGDPTGSWSLTAKDFEANGEMIGGLRLPTLVVQEGGYNTRNLGINARNFFNGLYRGIFV